MLVCMLHTAEDTLPPRATVSHRYGRASSPGQRAMMCGWLTLRVQTAICTYQHRRLRRAAGRRHLTMAARPDLPISTTSSTWGACITVAVQHMQARSGVAVQHMQARISAAWLEAHQVGEDSNTTFDGE